mgnify:CR=1 FL=1
MEVWERIHSRSIQTPSELPEPLIPDEDIKTVIDKYPMKINPYILSLIKEENDPIYRQFIPSLKEINDHKGKEDPLKEEEMSPAPCIIKRYPDRVVFLVSSQCASYCRFCNRKRMVGRSKIRYNDIIDSISYIRSDRSIRDVLLSGGDPLILPDRDLFNILTRLREIPHVEIIRIGTRIPCSLPQRITPELVKMLKGFHPLYINIHFNHPSEITPQSSRACNMLADAGIPLGSQSVLLRGINDDHHTIKRLMQMLLKIRVRPYYLFQADRVKGTSHFWTPLEKGIEIIKSLIGHTSGLCIPHFVVDLPGGGGKVPLIPQFLLSKDRDGLVFKNYQGKPYHYPFP